MESFDDMIRQKMAEQKIPEFEEKYWLEAEKLLDKIDRRKPSVVWLWADLAGLCLLFGLWCFASKSGFFEQKMVENVPKSTILEEKSILQPTENTVETATFDDKIRPKSVHEINQKQTELSKKIESNLAKNDSKTFDNLTKKQLFQTPKTPKTNGNFEEKTVDLFSKSNSKTKVFEIEMASAKPKLADVFSAKTNSFSEKNAEIILAEKGSVITEKTTQLLDNQLVETENLPVLKSFFKLESIETRRVFVENSANFIPENLLKIKPISPAIAKILKTKNRTHFGIEAGFEWAKNTEGIKRSVNAYSLGFFAERALNQRFSTSIGIDYQWITRLGYGFLPDSASVDFANNYSFGLEKVQSQTTPTSFHVLRPNLMLKIKIFNTQWLEIGIAERILLGAQVDFEKKVTSPFNETTSLKMKKGFLVKNAGFPRFSTETRLAWNSNFGRHAQISLGWNYQLNAILTKKTADSFKFDAPHWFDVRVRYQF
jgi:hypothetical protein